MCFLFPTKYPDDNLDLESFVLLWKNGTTHECSHIGKEGKFDSSNRKVPDKLSQIEKGNVCSEYQEKVLTILYKVLTTKMGKT